MEHAERLILGVDPGKSGGSVLLNGRGDVRGVLSFSDGASFVDFLDGKTVAFAVIEHVHAMPGQGVTSMFTFGENFGFIQGVLAALKIPVRRVTPQKWQASLGVGLPKDKTPKKNKLKQIAGERFPSTKWTLATCDAVLIANYGLETIPGARDLP